MPTSSPATDPSSTARAITAPIAGRYVVRIGRVMVLWGLLLVVLGLGLSIGVALSSADDGSLETALARADAALYRAKAGGRNQVRVALGELASIPAVGAA